MRGDIREFLKRVALAFGLVTLLLFLTNLPGILALRFPDPDDALRLVQLRDWLAGQGWYDMVQHRVDPAPVSYTHLAMGRVNSVLSAGRSARHAGATGHASSPRA